MQERKKVAIQGTGNRESSDKEDLTLVSVKVVSTICP